MSNVLIVEDNKKINELLTLYCNQDGYNVYSASSAEEGLEMFNKYDIDVIVSDLMLPNMSGEEMIKIIRESSSVYIIILTAKTDIDDKLHGLTIGADDYIVKPFSFEELMLKIKNFSKRVNKTNDELCFYNKELCISTTNNIILLNKNEIELTSNEYKVLLFLSKNPSKIYTREQLLDYCYGHETDVYDRVIDVYIKNIRKKLKEDSKNPKYIKTVYGLGYKFIGVIDE